jgi:hypothetical protein
MPFHFCQSIIKIRTNQAELQKDVGALVIVDHFQTKTKKRTKTFIKSKKQSGVGLGLKQEGIYNITVDIRGETKNGDIFERTIVQSVCGRFKGKNIQSIKQIKSTISLGGFLTFKRIFSRWGFAAD